MLFSRLLNGINDHRPIPPDYEGDAANDAIKALIESPKPCLIARFGCVELDAILRGYDKTCSRSSFVKFCRLFTGGNGPYWWDNSIRKNMLCTTGVFPADDATLEAFSKRALEDSRQVDMLGSWNARELELKKKFFPTAKAVKLGGLEPYFAKRPWTMSLKGLRVLVVHPFCDTIRKQYARRRQIFPNADVLPDFDLLTYKPVSSFLGIKTPFANWFEALDKMSEDISRMEFDVAILGCGAYGFSLGAFIKRDLGRKAVHLGGTTQLLFGIKGRRWDCIPKYARMYNDAWTRAIDAERPKKADQIEGGCYW